MKKPIFECHGKCNSTEVCTHKITFSFLLNLPLHNQAACCYTRNLLLCATINMAEWQHGLRTALERAVCAGTGQRRCVLLPTHTTECTHYDLTQCKGTLIIITVKNK